jgi:hypothetical protein
MNMEAAANQRLSFGEGMTAVEGGDGFENGLERIALMLACVSERESVQAFAALVYLERAHTIPAFARSDGIGTVAFLARGPFFGVLKATTPCRSSRG